MQPFSFLDVMIFFIYLIIFGLGIIFFTKGRMDEKERKIFLNAFLAKTVFTILYCMIIKFVYTSGDSLLYYRFAVKVNNLEGNSIINTLKFFENPDITQIMDGSMSDNYLKSARTVFMIKLTAIINLFTFKSFLVTSWFYSLFAFAGVWFLYRSLNKWLGSHFDIFLTLLLFYFPTFSIWTSGILKDTLIAGSLAFYLYGFINIMLGSPSRFKNILFIVLSLILMMQVKSYVAYSLLACIIFYFMAVILGKINNTLIKATVLASFFTFISGFVVFFSAQLMQSFNQFIIENLLQDAIRQYERLDSVTIKRQLDNSRYSLGIDIFNVQLTPITVLKLIPNAIITTLYRPFLWEVNKVLQLFSALENLFGFILSMWFILKTGFFRFFKILFSQPFFVYLVAFVLIFAFFIGLSSGNFGTLSRYRTPCIATYYILLYMVYYRGQQYKVGIYK